MNQTQFIYQLKQELEKYRVDSIEDILSDYKEHFIQGQARGKSEEEISQGLGSPVQIAKAYQVDALVKKVHESPEKFRWTSAFKTIGLFMILAPFNFFLFFIPGVLIFSFLMGGWGIGVGICALALVGIFWIPGVIALTSSYWLMAGVFMVVIGLMALAGLVLLSLFIVTKFILLGILRYFQWNLKFLLQKEVH